MGVGECGAPSNALGIANSHRKQLKMQVITSVEISLEIRCNENGSLITKIDVTDLSVHVPGLCSILAEPCYYTAVLSQNVVS